MVEDKKAIPVKKTLVQKVELTPITLKDYIDKTSNSHRIIGFGETACGKTRGWMKIFEYLKKHGVKPKDVLMYVLYPDRATGVTKIAGTVPEEYINEGSIMICECNNYEETVGYTNMAVEKLTEHHQKSPHAWLVIELLGVYWVFAQDYYTRKAYSEELGDFFAEMKQRSKKIRDSDSAYQAMEGWRDWTVVKFMHNEQWIDKIKKVPFNIWITAEVKEADDSPVFSDTGRPAGEKDNIHRFDEIICFSRTKTKFFMEPLKLTGYTMRYPKQDITGKNPYEVHLEKLKWLESEGYIESPVTILEKKAGITPPEKPEEEEEEQEGEETKPKVVILEETDEYRIEKRLQDDDTYKKVKVRKTKKEEPKEKKTIKTVRKGESGKEKEEKISQKELTKKPTKGDFEW